MSVSEQSMVKAPVRAKLGTTAMQGEAAPKSPESAHDSRASGSRAPERAEDQWFTTKDNPPPALARNAKLDEIVRSLPDDIQALQAVLSKHYAEVREYRCRIELLDKHVDSLRAQLSVLNGRLQAKTQEFEALRNSSDAKAQESEQRVSALTDALAAAASANVVCRERMRTLERAAEDLGQRLALALENAALAQGFAADLQGQLTEARGRAEVQGGELQSLRERIGELEPQLAQARHAEAVAQDRTHELTVAAAQMQAQASQADAVSQSRIKELTDAAGQAQAQARQSEAIAQDRIHELTVAAAEMQAQARQAEAVAQSRISELTDAVGQVQAQARHAEAVAQDRITELTVAAAEMQAQARQAEVIAQSRINELTDAVGQAQAQARQAEAVAQDRIHELTVAAGEMQAQLDRLFEGALVANQRTEDLESRLHTEGGRASALERQVAEQGALLNDLRDQLHAARSDLVAVQSQKELAFSRNRELEVQAREHMQRMEQLICSEQELRSEVARCLESLQAEEAWRQIADELIHDREMSLARSEERVSLLEAEVALARDELARRAGASEGLAKRGVDRIAALVRHLDMANLGNDDHPITGAT